MKNVRVARRYAQALMMASETETAIDRTAGDLEMVGNLLQRSREFRLLVFSPVVSASKKTVIFKQLFEERIGKTTLTFMNLLASKEREALLPMVIEQYMILRDERQGIVNVDVSAAVEFSTSQEKDLAGKLEKYTRKKVRVRFSLDKAIKGGLVIKIGDTVLDASIRRQLELLKEQFIEGGAVTN